MIGLLREVRSEALGSMATAGSTSWEEAPRAFDPLECLPENVSKEESASEGSDWEAWPSAGEVVRQRREEMRVRDHKLLMDALSGQSSLSVVRRRLLHWTAVADPTRRVLEVRGGVRHTHKP